MWYIFECLWENWDSTLDTNKANSEISGLARIHSIMLSQVLETCFNRAMILTANNFLSIEQFSTVGITLKTFFVFIIMKTKPHMHPSSLHHKAESLVNLPTTLLLQKMILVFGLGHQESLSYVLPKDYNMYKPIYMASDAFKLAAKNLTYISKPISLVIVDCDLGESCCSIGARLHRPSLLMKTQQ